MLFDLYYDYAGASGCSGSSRASQDQDTLGPLSSAPTQAPRAASPFPLFSDPIPKQCKFPSASYQGTFFGSLNFSPNSGFKTTPRSLPGEQGPHCSSLSKEHASWGLCGHDPLPALAEGSSFVLGAFLLVGKRSTHRYLSEGLTRSEEIPVLIRSKVSLVPDIIRQPAEF